MGDPQQISVGTVLGGDFRLVKPLGAGGMGVVFIAEQLSTNRQRAVKVMRSALVSDDKQRERFIREAKATASIESAHVVEVISAGVSEGGVPWLAMELLRGKDLAAYLGEHGPLQMPQVLGLFEQLCHALGAAHERGVVHRDVKPENIFLARTHRVGGELVVKVLDFGIAKVVDASKTAGTAALGSPLWMAPEQTDPDVPISPATDVWALGLLGFWLLTGANYWKSAKGNSFNIHEMLKEVLFNPLDPPTQRAEAKGVAAARLPAGFDQWFEGCVHREPRARFSSAVEAYRALAELSDDTPVALLDDRAADDEKPSEPEQAPRSDQSTGEFLDGLGLSDNHVLRDYLPAADREVDSADTVLAPADLADVAQAATQGTTLPEAAKPERAKAPAERGSRLGRTLAVVATLTLLAGAVGYVMMSERVRTPDGPLPPDSSDTPIDLAPSNDPPQPPPSHSQPPPLPPPPVVSAVPSASQSVAPLPRPAPAPAPRPAPVPQPIVTTNPTASATTSATTSASPAEPPPFDRRAAKFAIDSRIRTASLVCKGMHGPPALAGAVVFEPSGYVRTVNMAMSDRATGSGMCVAQHMMSVRIPAYTGGPENMGFAVVLN